MNKNVLSLKHIKRETLGGAKILVLNTGAVITPEAEAMLQALYSRSTQSVEEHLKILAERGSAKFMETYYVGYGHKSIGDCGSCTLFVEGISMLAAKAIQNFPLYNGQESSTRYIDFGTQRFLDPLDSHKSSALLSAMRVFYLRGFSEVVTHLKEIFPPESDFNETQYEKTIRARGFDVMRAFLPPAATTNVAWHGELRQVADHLLRLRHHPLREVCEIAESIESALIEAFPSSFSDKRYRRTEQFLSVCASSHYYDPGMHAPIPDVTMDSSGIFEHLLSKYRYDMGWRPPKTELPKKMAECGDLQFDFWLDFASFRDIQRHRAVSQLMPLLTYRYGFEKWYLEQMPNALRLDARKFLNHVEGELGAITGDDLIRQYYTPMGYRVPNRLTGDVAAVVYLLELRSGQTVHPTLRNRVHQMGNLVLEEFSPYGLRLHMDMSPTRFDIKRGAQDIVKVS